MSLQHAAHYLASQGRGPDDTLVHMTRREVQSLQDIARAHGGSLTINPETGLVEAGFLKNLLPMIAGMGITALTGGAAAPWMIGLGVGGLQAARTGSLEKGLMAGLGAYGGAGLMGAGQAAAGAVDHMGAQSAAAAGDATAGISNLPVTEQLKGAYAGLGTEAGRSAAMGSLGGGFGAAKTAGMALAPALMDSGNQSAPPADNERYNYKYDSGRVYNPNEGYTGAATGERTYFRPSYTRLPNSKGFNEGGIAHFDDGGATNEQPVAQNPTPFSGNVPFAQPATPPAQVGSIQPITSNPFYTMSGQSGDAYKYLMGQAPTSGTSPTIATKPVYNTPTTNIGGVEGGTSVINAPTGPVTPFDSNFTEPAQDTYDQDNQNAIDKVEQEVENEQYDQDNQDAINRYEDSLYDDTNQDAINRVEDAVRDDNFAESARASDIDDATISTDPVYPVDNTTADFWEPNPVATPTPEELVNRDEWGDLQSAIDTNTNIDASAAALEREALARENPWGNLDEAIAARNMEESARASDIDAATIGADNYGTYSGFTPEPANPNIPVEDRTPSVAKDNGAAEAAIREQEAAAREKARSYSEGFNNSAYNDSYNPSAGIHGYTDAQGDYHSFASAGQEQGDNFGTSEYGGHGNGFMDAYSVDYGANGGLMAAHRYAMGGSTLGGYSDGGRLLRGPGDGVSDSIPATIGAKRQPARLADGEFVVPARIVSELGNGSTEAGARKLYAMMERIQATRGNTVGRNRVATNTRADKHLPA